MATWRIWSGIAYGAFEFLGEAEGETFADACQAYAASHPAFAAEFNTRRLTFQGFPLVPLDRRIDGEKVCFGEVRDIVADSRPKGSSTRRPD